MSRKPPKKSDRSRPWRSGERRSARYVRVQMTRHLIVCEGTRTEPGYFNGLKAALEEVEMPASYYEKARTSYGSLSCHLLREESVIAGYRPERFTAHAEGIKNFRVRWQVTNDGREALQANCLRGDFYESAILKDERKTRVESTLYAGRHYVECILERDGVVYGRSEPFVVNIVDGASANRNW